MSALRPPPSVLGSRSPVPRPLPSVLCLAPLVWLWCVLIQHLHYEWSLNPQYAYGYIVPLLCVFLLWRRLQLTDSLSASTGEKVRGEVSNDSFTFKPPASVVPSPSSVLWLAAFAFLYLPVRLIQEANPEWRLVSWALALITIALTLALIRLILPLSASTGERAQGEVSNDSIFSFQRFSVWYYAFPIAFFLVAVPWPTLVEGPLIQLLSRINSGGTTEILNLIGVPAIQHGNVIEVSTGMVGIDDACSGIRSFQASLMISLFFGELYSLSVIRRMVLCLSGFVFSLTFNIVRTALLTWVAATKGVSAIAGWHDPAGVTILVACFLTLWLFALVLRGQRSGVRGQKSDMQSPSQDIGSSLSASIGDGVQREVSNDQSVFRPLSSDFSPPSSDSASKCVPRYSRTVIVSAFALLIWLAFSEIAVEAWYRLHERQLPDPVTWTVDWPEDNPTFRELPLTETTARYLRYDEGRNAAWKTPDGTDWQTIFLHWNPGRTAVHLAKNHTPEACLAAVGYNPRPDPELHFIDVNGLSLPFRHYTLNIPGAPTHVYYCLWEDRAVDRRFHAMGLSYANRLEPVLAGRRLTGQRSLEVVLTGIENSRQAEAALKGQLKKLIRVE